MGFLTGKVKQINSTPNDIRPLRQGIASQLQQGLNGNALAQAYQGVLGQGGPPPAQDTRFFYDNILKPYTDLFAAQRSEGLAQAKEAAGNLTGSGYNNILGQSAAGSIANEQALTAQTLMGLRQQEIQRQQNMLGMLFGFAQQGVGPNQSVYQPGLLDAALPFAGNLLGGWLGGRQQQQYGGPQMPQGPVPQPFIPTIPNQMPGQYVGQPNLYQALNGR